MFGGGGQPEPLSQPSVGQTPAPVSEPKITSFSNMFGSESQPKITSAVKPAVRSTNEPFIPPTTGPTDLQKATKAGSLVKLGAGTINTVAGEKLVPGSVTGGLGTAIGVGNIAGAFTGEGPESGRIVQGLGGTVGALKGGIELGTSIGGAGKDLASGLSGAMNTGITQPLGQANAVTGAVPSISGLDLAGTGLGAAGLALNWDKMDDTDKAMQTAQLATSALALAGYAIPYVGPVLALASAAKSLFGGKGENIEAKRARQTGEKMYAVSGGSENLRNAQTIDAGFDAIRSFDSGGSSPVAVMPSIKPGMGMTQPLRPTPENKDLFMVEAMSRPQDVQASLQMAADDISEGGRNAVNNNVAAGTRQVALKTTMMSDRATGDQMFARALAQREKMAPGADVSHIIKTANDINQTTALYRKLFFTPEGLQSDQAKQIWEQLDKKSPFGDVGNTDMPTDQKWGTVLRLAGIPRNPDYPEAFHRYAYSWISRVSPEMAKEWNQKSLHTPEEIAAAKKAGSPFVLGAESKLPWLQGNLNTMPSGYIGQSFPEPYKSQIESGFKQLGLPVPLPSQAQQTGTPKGLAEAAFFKSKYGPQQQATAPAQQVYDSGAGGDSGG